MTVEQMRWAIMKVYPGTDWIADCYALSDFQVAGMYTGMLHKNQIKVALPFRRKR